MTSFGPWSTSIGTGTDQQLSTFWKRRLAMLPTVTQSASRVTRRAVAFLAVLALIALALPMLRWDAGQTDAVAALADAEYFPRPAKIEQEIAVRLGRPTTIDFVDLPLEDCLTFLHDFHGISIWFDKTVRDVQAIPSDLPITLRLEGVALRSVLKLILEPLQLTYAIEDEVLKITSKPAGKLITRTYPVQDLYRSGPPRGLRPGGWIPEDLERAITKSVEPDSWDETKGPASLTYVKESGSLVIRQTFAAHEEILQLLRDLREAKRTGQGLPKPTQLDSK
jgi:hypothetical protein